VVLDAANDPSGGPALAAPRYLPRLTENDTKPIQRALAGATLFDDGLSLDGVVVEAAYAVAEPEVLDHLREQRVPVLIDPQSLRLSTPAYLSNTRLGSLPYLPSAPLTPSSSASDRDHFVADALRFQQKVGATYYLVPSSPVRDDPGWAELHHDLTARAASANGREVDSRELVALLAPGSTALRSPRAFVSRLLDLPVAAVYRAAASSRPPNGQRRQTGEGLELLPRTRGGRASGNRWPSGRVRDNPAGARRLRLR